MPDAKTQTTYGVDFSHGKDKTCVAIRNDGDVIKFLFGVCAEFFLLSYEVTHG